MKALIASFIVLGILISGMSYAHEGRDARPQQKMHRQEKAMKMRHKKQMMRKREMHEKGMQHRQQ